MERYKLLLRLLCLLFAVTLTGCRSNDKKTVNGREDLQKAVIGVQLGTTSDLLATEQEKLGKGAHVERFTKSADAIQALTQGKIDCMVEDDQPAKAFVKTNPALTVLPGELGHSDYAICVAKGNEQLLTRINGAIDRLKKDGTLDSIMTRHIDRGINVAYTPREQAENAPVLRFSTNATFPPFDYYDNGKVVGIDTDVANAICDQLHCRMEMIDMEFDAVITSVQTGKADAAIAGLTVTEDRKKSINFTVPYSRVRQVIVVNSGRLNEQQGLVEKFKTCFLDGNRYEYIYKGLQNTLVITFFALLLSLCLGTLVAIIRATHDRNGTLKLPNLLCQLYLTVFRGTPTMVQLLIIYYVVFASANVDKIVVASIAFGLNSAAYVSEVIRSGIMSVDRGQMEAGRSLGLSYTQTLRFVILPQAFKNVLPAIGNELITLLKETSISGYIGLVDLTKGSDIIRSLTYEAMLPLTMVALIYLLLVLVLYLGVRRLEAYLRRNERHQ